MKTTLTATVLIAGALSLYSADAIAAKNGIFVYGCTSDGKPARMRVIAPLKDKGAVEAGFRNMIRQKTSAWFLAQKKTVDLTEIEKALEVMVQSSGGKLPPQNPSAVARSVEIGKRAASLKLYCGA
ncbi:hypothetical protein IB277_03965 [Ensifer sp. ENS07]|uniref:hypothetical protein n=1 Tax=Ensifer sp. ENS07 TaxID=2769274 RepID=UPI00178543E8|nr:hypothetical protein [Ensifer sp. ENS07]MBD9635459.1 hypothetical protein [Ensifer sp. ENS07]